jgi:hypothetical protein
MLPTDLSRFIEKGTKHVFYRNSSYLWEIVSQTTPAESLYVLGSYILDELLSAL